MFVLALLTFLNKAMGLRLSKPLFLCIAVLVGVLSGSHAAAQNTNAAIEIETCENYLVSQDIESRYNQLQKSLESDFKSGVPHQIRIGLINVRKKIDNLTLRLFDLEGGNPQEVNLLVQETLNQVELMIGLLPQASRLAPQMRDQYVVPFTNISSIKADHQECMMKLAVRDAKEEIQKEENRVISSQNVYQKLTKEMNQLNQNLYVLETTDLQKYIGLRGQLMATLEAYNEKQEFNPQIVSQLPNILNSVQSEIERMLPGLQLSEKYYSIVD